MKPDFPVGKFKIYEIVRVIAVPPPLTQSLMDKEGVVVGKNDGNEAGQRDYAVYFECMKEILIFFEDLIESSGNFGASQDVIKGLDQVLRRAK